MKKRTPHDSNGPEWAARKKTQTQDKSKSQPRFDHNKIMEYAEEMNLKKDFDL